VAAGVLAAAATVLALKTFTKPTISNDKKQPEASNEESSEVRKRYLPDLNS